MTNENKDAKKTRTSQVKKAAFGRKDVAEKSLEEHNDVFADILNVCLFGGTKKITAGDLRDAKTASAYEGKEGLRAQERDVAKIWENSRIRLAFFGLENQTEPQKDAPLRIIGYDGAAYRDQLYKVKTKDGKWKENDNPRYPVITLILYFGYEKRWNQPKRLMDVLENVPEELKPFVNDYEIHVFEVAWMTDEQLAMLKSDFKIIAEYLVQMRKGQEYTPSMQEIVHAREVLALMEAMTKDQRFSETYKITKEKGKEPKYMCEALDRIENRGIKRGQVKYIMDLLEDLGEVPPELIDEVNAITDMEMLSKIHMLAARATSIEDFRAKLADMCVFS